jgi:hypothetical protein
MIVCIFLYLPIVTVYDSKPPIVFGFFQVLVKQLISVTADNWGHRRPFIKAYQETLQRIILSVSMYCVVRHEMIARSS